VGQGVDNLGVTGSVWTDHTDVPPNILNLVGLRDYTHDGRVVAEVLLGYAQPSAVKKSTSFVPLAAMYKQLNASFGEFAMAVLKSSTHALASSDPNDDTYLTIEGQIDSLTTQRNAVAVQMKTLLDDAEFNGKSFTDAKAQSLSSQGQSLIDQANALPH